MGDVLVFFIVIGVIAGVGYYLYQEVRYKLVKAKNFIMREQGNCIYCKHCYANDKGELVCALSQCSDIDEDTVMDCFEKPKVSEKDIDELRKLGIFNDSGIEYVKEQLLGKKMILTEFEERIKKIAAEHPEMLKKN